MVLVIVVNVFAVSMVWREDDKIRRRPLPPPLIKFLLFLRLPEMGNRVTGESRINRTRLNWEKPVASGNFPVDPENRVPISDDWSQKLDQLVY